MSDAPHQTIRIFISSPGDVVQERDGARRVIEGLQRLYTRATLQPVLWEQLVLPVTASFQETIDFLLEREPIDIAVFILWSRLGSPLGASITRPDGTPYRSGTERELDLMLTAFEQSGRKRPVILAYARDDYEGFTRKLAESPRADRNELIDQQQLAETFILEQFHDDEGRNVRAYQTYREPIGFVQRLRVHLRQVIDDLLEADTSRSWTEDPYRGLEFFDVQHAAIFHGRDEETCRLLQRLRDQERAGCAFVVIVGASGSGKSSLARAGVAAGLLHHVGDDDTKQWRELTFIPSLGSDNLCAALVRSIAETLPELNESARSLDDISESLTENAEVTVRLSMAAALDRAAEQAGGKVRLLLILDQMEELWTDRRTTVEDRERFLLAVEALARSGHVAVLATLRSDFYHHAQQSPTFLRAKGKLGQFDLLPPDSASLQRLITEPARLAGLRFERDEQTGRSLDKRILKDASRDAGALPLLQYALAELYQRRDKGRRLLTFDAYDQLGGVDGALARRVDETFSQLPADAQAALDEILPLLVTVDVAGEQSAVRRRAPLAALVSTPARRTLTEQLTAARFLTTDRQDNNPVAGLAHEALLRRWDRIVAWIETNRQHLQRRARVEHNQQRWEQQDKDESLLLADGLPLDESRQLLREAPYLVSDATSTYIHASIDHCRRKSTKSRRNRTMVLSTIAALLVLMIVGGIYLRRSTVANSLVRGLLQANTSEVPAIVRELAKYSTLARADLKAAWAESPDNSDAKLHAGLALISVDSSVLPQLKERLLSARPDQVETIRTLLVDQKDRLTDELWQVVEADDPAHLLQAAGALAAYDVDNDRKWTQAAPKIAGALAGENSLRAAVWIKTLEPARAHLIGPLSDIYRDQSGDREPSQIDLATELLEEYAADDPDTLRELLLDGRPKQFAALFDEFAAHGDHSISRMNAAFEKEKVSSDSAHRQANAVTALLRIGQMKPAIEVMHHDLSNPEVMTQFVHRCRACGVSPTQLLSCLDEVERARRSSSLESRRRLDRACYGLLLALGEFDLDDVTQSDRARVTSRLIEQYGGDPSSAVHGATGWVLRKWGFENEVRRIDQTPRPFDESYERDWYVIAIDTPPNNAGKSERIYFTMIVFPPGEFVMGSPEDEPYRLFDEQQHRVRLTRPLAVSDREVTWAQFNPYDQAGHHDQWEQEDKRKRAWNDPATGVSWFEAVAFCRWLTTVAGMPESSQCYSPDPLESNRNPKPGWVELPDSTPWPVNPEGRGFRILTEAEWEAVCRSGTGTAYSFGNDGRLLGKYGWFLDNSQDGSHAVAQLRPNARGLFDLHGNVFEWCHDWYSRSASTDVDPRGADTGLDRVFRGGSWFITAGSCRSSFRFRSAPSTRDKLLLGFRVASFPSNPSRVKSPASGAESESGPSGRAEP